MNENQHINDGGPAFPNPIDIASVPLSSGMTLRDYFAGQALVALVSNQKWFDHTVKDHGARANESFAHDAYRFAEALIAERSKAQ